MSESTQADDGLLAVLKAHLTADNTQAFSYLVLYTSFGVVRGRTGMSFLRTPGSQTSSETDRPDPPEVVEVHDAAVEHYSNHLPTATFTRLHVRIDDIRGFAIVDQQGQG